MITIETRKIRIVVDDELNVTITDPTADLPRELEHIDLTPAGEELDTDEQIDNAAERIANAIETPPAALPVENKFSPKGITASALVRGRKSPHRDSAFGHASIKPRRTRPTRLFYSLNGEGRYSTKEVAEKLGCDQSAVGYAIKHSGMLKGHAVAISTETAPAAATGSPGAVVGSELPIQSDSFLTRRKCGKCGHQPGPGHRLGKCADCGTEGRWIHLSDTHDEER
jgi:hypothetical protein